MGRGRIGSDAIVAPVSVPLLLRARTPPEIRPLDLRLLKPPAVPGMLDEHARLKL